MKSQRHRDAALRDILYALQGVERVDHQGVRSPIETKHLVGLVSNLIAAVRDEVDAGLCDELRHIRLIAKIEPHVSTLHGVKLLKSAKDHQSATIQRLRDLLDRVIEGQSAAQADKELRVKWRAEMRAALKEQP